MRRYHRLSIFADAYEAFILDLWGVIHDGQALYPEALPALEALHKKNKKIIFLSNAPRRSWKAEAVLTKLGVPREWYISVLTSGEVTHDYVRSHFTNHKPQAASRYYYIGPEKDADILSGLSLAATHNASQAGFALATGFDNDDSMREEKIPDIEKCLAARLPLLCANPDHIVVRQSGKVLLCAGAIADEYQKRGGDVIYFGKPYPEIYQRCLSLLTAGDDKPATIALGDSLHTDIAGARNAGIFSVLVTGGILQKDFATPYGELPEQHIIENLCQRESIRPDAVLPCFRW